MNNNGWIAVILVSVLLAGVLGWKVLIDKTAERVIQKLQKPYSPSPYGPGIDPDKLDVEKIQRATTTSAKPDVWFQD